MTVTCRLLTVACCFIGTATLAAEPTRTFKCEGPFGREATHARLASKYGAANIATEYDGEADAEVTILFPNDPERRLKIQWKDQKARQNPQYFTIEGRSSWSVAGVAIGTSLIELQRLNGGPFKLNYFEGDYGGAITDWLKGRLDAPVSGGCVLGAFVGIDERLPESKALDEEVTPDRSLLSSGMRLRAAKPVVTQMIVSFSK
ncbi:hypothetical protein QMZ05_33540 [Bradyrhizobium sp. INPA03-11B]|uniref:hypothetical protein n=1 Tax=Bradyrhizobium sp. INPA03-11B TaxID=418598 RepID=UPI0033906135